MCEGPLPSITAKQGDLHGFVNKLVIEGTNAGYVRQKRCPRDGVMAVQIRRDEMLKSKKCMHSWETHVAKINLFLIREEQGGVPAPKPRPLCRRSGLGDPSSSTSKQPRQSKQFSSLKAQVSAWATKPGPLGCTGLLSTAQSEKVSHFLLPSASECHGLIAT